MVKLKILLWWKGHFDSLAASMRSNMILKLFGWFFTSVTIPIILFFTSEGFRITFDLVGHGFWGIVLRLIPPTLLIFLGIILLFCILYFSLTILFYLIVLAVSPWTFAWKYGALLEFLREKHGIKSRDTDRKIEQKEIKVYDGDVITAKDFNKYLEWKEEQKNDN